MDHLLDSRDANDDGDPRPVLDVALVEIALANALLVTGAAERELPISAGAWRCACRRAAQRSSSP